MATNGSGNGTSRSHARDPAGGRRRAGVAALAAAAGLTAAAAPAATYTWRGGAGNAWNLPGNWVGNAVPPSDIANTDLVFAASPTLYPSIQPAYAIHSLTFAAAATPYVFDTGPLTIGAGGLAMNTAGGEAFSTAPVLLAAAQTWALNGTGPLTFGPGLNTSGYALTLNTAATSTIAGVVSGGGGLTKTGAGTLTLASTNTYTGPTNLSAGTLALGGSGALGAAGAIAFAGGTLRYTAADATDYSTRFSSADGQPISVDTNGQSVTFAGHLTGNGTSLTKLGAGTLTLGNAGFYTGGTTAAAGTLALGSGSAIGSAGTVSLTGGTLQFSANNRVDYSARLSAAANQQYRLDTNGQSVAFGSPLTSPGGTLTKLGAGTLTLNAASNYSGGTTIAAGTLSLGGAGAVGTAGTIAFAGGTLGFTPGNTADLSARFSAADNQPYSVDTNGRSATFAAGLNSSGGSLTKLGTGTLTLTGASGYTGPTNVAGGTLVVAGSVASPAVFVAPAATYNTSATTTSAAINVTNGTFAFATSGTLAGPGTTAVIGTFTSAADHAAPGLLTALTGTLNNSAGHTVLLGDPAGGQAGTVSAATTLTNDGTIDTAPGNGSVVVTAAKIANAGTLRTTGGFMYVDAPTIVNDGVIQSSGQAANIYLNQANYSGGTTVTGTGSWSIDNALILVHPTVVSTTGTFTVNEQGLVFIQDSGAGGVTSALSASTLVGAGTLSGGGSLTPSINLTNGDPTRPFTGTIYGNVGVNKSGPGTQVFTGRMSYSGPTNISGGTLQADNATSATGYGLVDVQSGGTLAGVGDVPTFINVESGGTLAPGDNGPGTITTFQLRLMAGSKIALDLSNTGNGSDFITDDNSGIADNGSTVTIADNGLTPGTAPVYFLSFVNALVVDGTNHVIQGGMVQASRFTLAPGGPVQGYFTVDQTNKRVGFVVTGVSLTFSGNSAAFDTTSRNFDGGTLAFAPGDAVTFDDTNAGSYTVTPAGVVAPASVLFNSSKPYAVTGAGTIGDGPNGPTTLAQTGSGSLTVSTVNTYTGGTTVGTGADAPTFTLAAAGKLATAALTVNAGASATVAGTLTAAPAVAVAGSLSFAARNGSAPAVVTLASLNVSGGGVVALAPSTTAGRTLLATSGLTLAATAKLDLSDNDLLVTGTTATAVAALLGGTATGLLSTAAANDPRHLTALAVVGNSQGGSPLFTAARPFDTATPAATDVLVRYTYYGDANLDGVVNGADYTRLDAGYAAAPTAGPLTGWYNGDFNYDGHVDGSDYTLADNAFDLQRAGLSPSAAAVPTAEVAAVPESAAAGVLAAAAAGLLARRRIARRRLAGNSLPNRAATPAGLNRHPDRDTLCRS